MARDQLAGDAGLTGVPVAKKFEGICIGGPLDGQITGHSEEIMSVTVSGDRCVGRSAGRSADVVTYRFETVTAGLRTFGLWIPSGVATGEAVASVFTLYQVRRGCGGEG